MSFWKDVILKGCHFENSLFWKLIILQWCLPCVKMESSSKCFTVLRWCHLSFWISIARNVKIKFITFTIIFNFWSNLNESTQKINFLIDLLEATSQDFGSRYLSSRRFGHRSSRQSSKSKQFTLKRRQRRY